VRSQVIRRIGPVESIAPGLWRFALDLLDRAVRQGILKDDVPGEEG